MSDFNAAQVLAEAYTLYKKHHDGMGLDFKIAIAQVREESEQRGAVKALREAATAIEKNQIMTQVGHLQPCNSCMVIHMDFLDYRANLLEGDDD